MKERELEGKLKMLALRKMRPGFKESLLAEIRKREKVSVRPSLNPTLILNCALSLSIVAVIFLARLTSSANIVKEISRTPDPIIVAAGVEFYNPQTLNFLAQSLTVESPGFKSRSEVEL